MYQHGTGTDFRGCQVHIGGRPTSKLFQLRDFSKPAISHVVEQAWSQVLRSDQDPTVPEADMLSLVEDKL